MTYYYLKVSAGIYDHFFQVHCSDFYNFLDSLREIYDVYDEVKFDSNFKYVVDYYFDDVKFGKVKVGYFIQYKE